MADAAFTYTDEEYGAHFIWHGGEYIDVYSHKDAEYPGECINVWNHAKDEPIIERTLDAFEETCRDWLRGIDPDDEDDEDEDREPTDDEIYNRAGMEGGIAYDITGDARDEHDPTL